MRVIILLLTILLWSLQALSKDEVGLLISRNESHLTRAELIRRETKELRLNTFTFNVDDFGKETLGLLAEAAERGVKVRLTIDGFEGTLPKNYAILRALEASGVEVKLFNPVFRKILSINNRNHQKSLIGSDFMILGDRNMTGDYFKLRSPQNYIGMDVLVKGKEVINARNHYDEIFNSDQMMRHAGIALKDAELEAAKVELARWKEDAQQIVSPRKALEAGNLDVTNNIKYIADRSDGKWSKKPYALHFNIVEMIDDAKKTLDFMNPYVLLTPETKKAVERAIQRGVKVRVLSNSAATTDSHLMGMAWEFQKQKLVGMGVEVHELKPGHFLHAKTIVKDLDEVFVGSFNLDPRSQNINLENGVFIKDKNVAKKIDDYNKRIRERLMVKVEKEVLPKKPSIGYCAKRGLRKMVSKIMFPLL
ncbi:phospholipase D-like domain-containing protein [Peredibacter sp. HCB2-198]|uniref:phospholipase D-like domain-containing protein n=1 Tax=Peredibacter sp. HCB2-198 TaxID=3383025 RepID=UPI0038B4EB3B